MGGPSFSGGTDGTNDSSEGGSPPDPPPRGPSSGPASDVIDDRPADLDESNMPAAAGNGSNLDSSTVIPTSEADGSTVDGSMLATRNDAADDEVPAMNEPNDEQAVVSSSPVQPTLNGLPNLPDSTFSSSIDLSANRLLNGHTGSSPEMPDTIFSSSPALAASETAAAGSMRAADGNSATEAGHTSAPASDGSASTTGLASADGLSLQYDEAADAEPDLTVKTGITPEAMPSR